MTLAQVQPALQVVAVDPAVADIVYMVSIGANVPNGDLLYRSIDGGMTWTAVLAATDTIRSVAFAGAHDVLVATPTASFRSADGGMTFAPAEKFGASFPTTSAAKFADASFTPARSICTVSPPTVFIFE